MNKRNKRILAGAMALVMVGAVGFGFNSRNQQVLKYLMLVMVIVIEQL